MTMELTVVISVGCALLGAILGFLTFKRAGDKAVAESAKSDGIVLTEIGYIKSGVDDIKAEQRDQRKMNQDLITRMTAVEASTKQAHKRLDRIEEKK